MKYELKLAGLTLAQQSRTLKKLEKSRNPKSNVTSGIHYARVHVLRKEARATHIALGFLRGRTLDQMEMPYRPLNQGHVSTKNQSRSFPDWVRVEELIVKHGRKYFETEQTLMQAFSEFKDTGSVGLL